MSDHQLVMLLVDLVLITVAARLLGRVAEMLGQPAVIGEIAAGIVAGPVVLGSTISTAIFPLDVQHYLAAFANVGIALFMFQAGLEIDRNSFSGARRLVTSVSIAAYAAPFVLGIVLGATLLARHAQGHSTRFAFFLGAALAVTAFPVLARILAERGLLRSKVGQIGLAAAAVNDVLAWTVLCVLVAATSANSAQGWRLIAVAPFLVAIVSMRRLLPRLSRSATPSALIAVGISGTLICGAATAWMGLHLIFGAFLFGLVFPREHSALLLEHTRLVSALFLPAFFVTAGLQVSLSGLDRGSALELGVIIAAAVLGKFGGTYGAARLCGSPPREAGMLASLMNTRGLTELVILVAGLSLGLIGPEMYSLLVIAALVTTAMTAPLLRLFAGRARVRSPGGDARTVEPALNVGT
ncbi:cation:proton antiporter [Nocardia bovistercoris]|uniref:Cation:proton antiporter n=1 Tax=Nocardia bovistercoris TaxID=2785916 RepID=A0A931ICR8_9NOCA|nr:cation:proton antiporter [Nocardia bovistercoris]MBH0779262.1 cation:proton antiporter [Nocardia bovistercoris]